MQPDLPFQRNRLTHLIPQNFGMFKLGKITFGLCQTNIVFRIIVCKANRKADILTTRLKIKDIL